MTRAKWISIVVLFCISLAMVLYSLFMPRVIEWYFEPPSNIGVSCSPAIHWAFTLFQKGQLAVLIFGFLLGVMTGFFLTGKKKSAPPVV